MSMLIMETKARAVINDFMPGIPSKEKPAIIRDIVADYMKHQEDWGAYSMYDAFKNVTSDMEADYE